MLVLLTSAFLALLPLRAAGAILVAKIFLSLAVFGYISGL